MKNLCYNVLIVLLRGCAAVDTELLNEDLTDKERTVCFSGHRPEKLPDFGLDSSQIVRVVKSLLYKEIIECIDNGYNTFITGLARGVDLWAGEIVLELQGSGRNIKLIAAVPYRGFGKNYIGRDKFTLGNILLKADKKIYLQEKFTQGCLQSRNRYMVDRSGKLLAIVVDYKSGTGQTIRYAQKQGVAAKIIDAGNLEEEIRILINKGEIEF